MEENVHRELQAIKQMVQAWKWSYIREAPPGGGGEFLAEDLNQEIETYVCPYLRRLHEMNHLSEPEMREFLDLCYAEVEDLRTSLREMDNPWLRAAGVE